MLKCLLGHAWQYFMDGRVMVRQCSNCGIVERV
jgi:hypothetical protein